MALWEDSKDKVQATSFFYKDSLDAANWGMEEVQWASMCFRHRRVYSA